MTNKYAQLTDLKAYIAATSTAEDTTLQAALDWAEGEFERLAGSQFDQQTVTNETAGMAWVDRNGMLHLVAAERGPVTVVSAVQVRYPGRSWQNVAWASDDLMLPPTSAPPHPRAWRVQIVPTQPLDIGDVDGMMLRWSYTGGYAQAPASLKAVILRLAAWKYKLREAPLGRVSTPPFGVTEIIPALPADVAADIVRWTKVATG